MPETSSHWNELVALDAPMVKQFYLGYGAIGDQRRASLIPALFNVQSSATATEKSFGVGTLGSDGWENFENSGRVPYDDIHKGWEKTYTHREFARGVVVERKLIDDNQTRIAFGRASALGDSLARKREKDAALIFNNAFATDTGPDSQFLCDTDHPYSAEDSTTYSNKGTSALSKSAVASTRVAMTKFVDDVGDLMDVMPDLLLIPPELEDTAIEITKSQLDPTSANNAVNPQAGRFSYLVWHYLTDTNNWFMIEKGRMKQFLNWFDRVPVEFGAEEDFDTLERKYRAYARWSLGYDDARWIYGHLVA
jgi:hypothetical protein